MAQQATNPAVDLASRLAGDLDAIDKELSEIDLLVAQATAEAGRHEGRRAAAADKLAKASGGGADPKQVLEQYEQLLTLTTRAALMESQVEVLEGKRRVLNRYRDALKSYAEAAGTGGTGGGGGAAGGADGPVDLAGMPPAVSRLLLTAQEDLRREISRAMHDGPAQSLTNIVLQAQIVERLVAADPVGARGEVRQLVAMVQQTLDATKSFIFDVRPMVLDDLGLLPTLRRTARERSQRSGIVVDLESHGQDRRLEPEIESSLFRILDDATAGYLAAQPAAVRLRLDWMEDRVTAAVLSEPAPDTADKQASVPSTLPSDADVPAALAGMIESRATEQAERAVSRLRGYAIDDELWAALESRARTVGISLVRADDGLRLEAVAGMPSASGSA